MQKTTKSACLAILFAAIAPVASAEDATRTTRSASEMAAERRSELGKKLKVSDRIADVLNHPAFSGFSELILPWDDRPYNVEMPLSQIGSLLPYHTNVVPAVAVDALNRMIEDVATGKQVFLDFYTEEQKRADPSKRHTGLFFYRGKPGARFAVIAPGGGFSYVGSVHEGFPYATEISKYGYNAFVLKYRAGSGSVPAIQDLAAAISYIFANARGLELNTQDYSVWGSSAGARMVASIGSHGTAKYGGRDVSKPAAVIMAYTGHSDYAVAEPPTFVVVGEQDGIASPSVMERRVAALAKVGTEVEFHRYKEIGHGFGPGNGTSAEGWIELAIRFWSRQIK